MILWAVKKFMITRFPFFCGREKAAGEEMSGMVFNFI